MRIVQPLEATGTMFGAPEPAARPASVLPVRALLVARLSLAAFAVLSIAVQAMTVIRAVDDADGLWLAAFGDPGDAQSAMSHGGLALVSFIALGLLGILQVATFLIVSTLLVWRSRETIAFFVALLLISSVGADFPPDLFDLMSTNPLWAILGLFVTFWFPLMLVVIFYVFPDGRFTPRWTIIPAGLWAGSLAWTFFVTRTLDGSGGWHRLIAPVALLLSIVVAQIYRYLRVSGPVERQQTKWFLSGLGGLLITFAGGNVVLVVSGGFDATPSDSAALIWPIFEAVTGLASISLPVVLAIAVFRYRLFDLDLVVNRALVYGALSVSVVGIYVLVVGYLGTLFRTGGNLLISLIATTLVAVIFQPLRERLQRGANHLLWGQRDEPYAVVARLGRQLEETIVPNSVLPMIVETVATALKLPYVAIALEATNGSVVAAEQGHERPSAIEIFPLIYHGERVAELRLSPRSGEQILTPADRRLVNDLARQAGIAVHAVQLTQDLQQARARLVTGREEERRRLRRDLHDGLGPMLASQALTIDAATVLLDRDPQGALKLLREAKAQSRAAIGEIRRVVYDLRPPALDDLGLAGAIRDLADQFTTTTLSISSEVPESLPALPAAIEVATFRIVQEGLTNIARHAEATRCTIRLHLDSELELEIGDDGIGIPRNRRAGVGLTSMRERVEELGGTYSITDRRNGGTMITARLPLKG
jgi:signal transduction histidine kinase